MTSNRKSLARMAFFKSIEVRKAANLDSRSPVCAFDLCSQLKIKLEFTGVSMEGMYVKSEVPLIILSALRPFVRRHFTCAHELGHHAFGHGTSFDELVEESQEKKFDPKEFLVNSFAGFLLMPIIAVRKAFASRGWDPVTATPLQLYIVACSFGVGYVTLVNHMAYALDIIDRNKAKILGRAKLRNIRQEALGIPCPDKLIIADTHWALPTLDAEVGTLLLLPKGTKAENEILTLEADTPSGQVFKANSPGTVQVFNPNSEWRVTVRISRQEYTGLYINQYRRESDGESQTTSLH